MYGGTHRFTFDVQITAANQSAYNAAVHDLEFRMYHAIPQRKSLLHTRRKIDAQVLRVVRGTT